MRGGGAAGGGGGGGVQELEGMRIPERGRKGMGRVHRVRVRKA